MLTQPGGPGMAIITREPMLRGLDYILDEARKRGLKVRRVEAWPWQPARSWRSSFRHCRVDAEQQMHNSLPLQTCMDIENALPALPSPLTHPPKPHAQVLLVLADYFASDAGGVQQNLQFSGLQSGTATAKAQFFTNSQAQAIYRSYIQQVGGAVVVQAHPPCLAFGQGACATVRTKVACQC